MYATLEQLKAETGIRESKDDDLLTQKIAEAQDILERTYKRRFEAPAPETRFVDYSPETLADNGRTLLLRFDVCQIDEVKNGDGTVISVDQYVTTPRLRSVSDGKSLAVGVPEWWPWYALTLKRNSGLRWMHNGQLEECFALTGRFAFSVTPPPAVVSATIRLAYWLYKQRDNAQNIPSPTAGKYGQILLPADLPEDVQVKMKGLKRVL